MYNVERPEDKFDRICSNNTSNHKRNRDVENTISASSIEEVEHKISINQSFNNSNLSNVPLSQNESDISMQDVGGSQPLSLMEWNL
ncbi:hypothetical protein Glove_349g16 [Diversispora epigaea]|uniref:Uncharacterized protein n=1 Tax=Diversispora epigaea TaxID=1348612 RepID=A0A397HJ13_9GLOM|nr:hypothetical protein Glove_349g16 [Diversispora epigaea]